MVIQYQNTKEEFVEASAALSARNRQKKKGHGGALVLGSLAIYFVSMGLLTNHLGRVQGSIAGFHVVFPLIYLNALFVIVAVIKKMTGMHSQFEARAVFGLSLIMIPLIWFARMELGVAADAQNGAPVWDWMLLIPHVTWMFLVASAIVAANKRPRDKWESLPMLRRPKSALITDGGISVTDPLSRHDHQWQAFIGSQETKSMFLLFLSAYHVVFLPKLAFTSDVELNSMREFMKLIPADPAR